MSKKVNCGSCDGVGLDINLYEHKGKFFCHNGCINAYEKHILPLETQLAEKEKEIERLRKIVIKVAEIAHMEAQDEFGLSWDDFKLNILYYRFEIMTDEEVNS